MARARREQEDGAPVEEAEAEVEVEHVVGEDDTAVATRTFIVTFDDADGMHEEFVTIPADAPAPEKGAILFDPEGEEDVLGRLVHRVTELDLTPAVEEEVE